MQKFFICFMLIFSATAQGSFKTKAEFLEAISNVLKNQTTGVIETTIIPVNLMHKAPLLSLQRIYLWGIKTTTHNFSLSCVIEFNDVDLKHNPSGKVSEVSIFSCPSPMLFTINNEPILPGDITGVAVNASLPYSLAAIISKILHGMQPGRVTSTQDHKLLIYLFNPDGTIKRIHPPEVAR